VDLPCIVETHKTLDRKTLLKTGDVSQMVVCSRGTLEEEDGEEKVEEMTAAKKKDLYKKFVWNHGSKCRWRWEGHGCRRRRWKGHSGRETEEVKGAWWETEDVGGHGGSQR